MTVSLQDPMRSALHIFWSTLQPLVTQWFDEHPTVSLSDLWDDRQNTNSMNWEDPKDIIRLLQNVKEVRLSIFEQHDVLKDLRKVYTARNNWAHFRQIEDRQELAQIECIARLLALAGKPDASQQVRALANLSRTEVDFLELDRRAKELEAASVNVTRREGAIRLSEQKISEANQQLEERKGMLEQQEQQIAQEEHRLANERQSIRQRLQALDQSTSAEELNEREEALTRETTRLRQMKKQYQEGIEANSEHRADMQQREASLAERERILSMREGDFERLRNTVDEMAERLDEAVQCLERTEQRSRQALALAQTSQAAEPISQPRSEEHEATALIPDARQLVSDSGQAQDGNQPVSRPCRRPSCAGHLELKEGRFGKFYGCTEYPVCRYTEDFSKEPDEEQVDYGECPDCEGVLIRRNGFRGPFLACINYPNCRYTQDM